MRATLVNENTIKVTPIPKKDVKAGLWIQWNSDAEYVTDKSYTNLYAGQDTYDFNDEFGRKPLSAWAFSKSRI